MSRTLSLAETLLERGRKYHDLGRAHDAQHILGRLAGLRWLPAPVAEETQVRLAELCLAGRRFPQARRHLTAALAHQPDSPRYHHLMATALAGDEKADQHRALEHFRKSLELDPDQPVRLAECGLLALRLGQTEEGLGCLRRAQELAPDDPAVIGLVVDGLCEDDRPDEARCLLLAALFRHGRDGRFRQLWDDFRFRQARREQERQRHRAGAETEDGGPTLLPFIRLVSETSRPCGRRKIIRHDLPAPPAPPHPGHRAGLPDRRHA